MPEDSDFLELAECVADERLLDQDQAHLPSSVVRPAPVPASRSRDRIVAIGAAMTGATLLLGIALLAGGAAQALWGGSALLGFGLVALGLLLVGTHWGWVHVAELTGRTLERRHDDELAMRNRRWLQGIEPYTRYEVTTSVRDDGSIVIARVRHRPVRSVQGRFTFLRETESTEVHSADEPGANVAERAESLRRQAALDTARELARFEAVADAQRGARLRGSDEQKRLAAERAASEALSEQINSNLRNPPLSE